MMGLDWQVLIAAFVAISLQITISINLVFGRSAVKKCNIWREADHLRVLSLDAVNDTSMMTRQQRILAMVGHAPREEQCAEDVHKTRAG